MKTIEVSESALESLKAMAQKLQEQRDMLLEKMSDILLVHSNDSNRPKAFYIASSAIAACQESTKVLES